MNSSQTDIVQEVLEGEETPLIKKSSVKPGGTRKTMDTQSSVRNFSQAVARRSQVISLFPYPEESAKHTINQHDRLQSMDQLSLRASRSKPETTTNTRSKGFKERFRQIEIERENKVLLDHMLHIEKDLGNIKKKISSQKPQNDLGFKSEMLSQTLQTSMLRESHHAMQNRKKTFKHINHENNRMFEKLKNL